MKGIGKLLRDLKKEMDKKEKELEVLRNQYTAMTGFFGKMSEAGLFTNSASKISVKLKSSRNGVGVKKNLFPHIVEFVKKNPNSTVPEIRDAVKGSDSLVRYHLNRNMKSFKTSEVGGLIAYSIAK